MIENEEQVNTEELTYVSTHPANVSSDDGFNQLKLEDEEKQQKVPLFVYFSAIVACMISSVKLGAMVVWISPVAKNLLSEDLNLNPLGAPINAVQLSIFGVIPGLTPILGTMFLGKMIDIVGRRNGMIMMSLPIVLMDICLAFATNIYMMYIPLIIIGFCLGGLQVGGRIYLTEIGESHYRTTLVCLGVLGMPFGNVCSFLISSCLDSYKMFSLASSVPFIVSLGCLIIFLPETPVYLMARDKREEALKALQKLRNNNVEALHKELKVIEFILEETSKSKSADLKTMFSDRVVRRAFLVTLGLHLIAFNDGVSAIFCYLIQIFDKVDSNIPNYISINSLTVIQLISCFISSKTSERYGRRTLLLASTVGNAFSLFSVGVYFYLKSKEFSYIGYISWWPIIGLGLFCISNSLGVASICWVIASEVFPTNVISMAMSILTAFDGLSASTTIFLFPMITDACGIHWNFWLYSAICTIGYIFVHMKLPETKGKNLIEIQQLFKK